MFKSFFLVCMVCFISMNGLSQREHYLQFYGNPFISSFEDANAEFISNSSRHVLVNYSKRNSGEFGLMYRQKINSKLAWGAGVGSRFDNYSVDVALIDYYVQNNYEYEQVLDVHFVNIFIQKTNIRLHFSYDLSERIGVGLNVNTYFPSVSTPGFKGVDNGASSSSFISTGDTSYYAFNYKYDFRMDRNFGKVSLVPELFVTAELAKGLNMIGGLKLAFWGKNNRYFNVRMDGSFDSESGVYSPELLHESAITAKDVRYFLGFTYDLRLKKRNKNLG